jgi:hypothetical protein
MPRVAYKGAHGSNDFPLHFTFFQAMDDRGLLDRFDFALDPMLDLNYCLKLKERFPQLQLTTSVSRARKMMGFTAETIGRFYRPFGLLDHFDAVIEGPGGRINPNYTRTDIFRLYPKVRRRALLFHSIEEGILGLDKVRNSIASCDLVIPRTCESAEIARQAGAHHVVTSTDIVWYRGKLSSEYLPGNALALRTIDNPDFQENVRTILEGLHGLGRKLDFVRIEEPIGEQMAANGYGTGEFEEMNMYCEDDMYMPFTKVRDAVISCRLHTTLLALLHGNRAIMQFQIEKGTNKIREIFDDLGLKSLRVFGSENYTLESIKEFLDAPSFLPEEEINSVVTKARGRVETGLDALEEWLDHL